MVTEQVNDAIGKALDHVKAKVSPNDGGAVEAAVEALRVAFTSDPKFAEKIAADMNAKMEAVNAREKDILKNNVEGKQKGPSDEAVKNGNPVAKGGVQASSGASSDNTTGQANGNSAGESAGGDVTGGNTGGQGSTGV